MKRLAIAAALFASPALIASPACADTLIDNVNGITLTADGTVQRFSGLVIGDDGKVIRLVTGKEPLWVEAPKKKRKERWVPGPGQAAFRVDGKGRTLMPGLIDAHGHVMGLGYQALTLDLSDTKSLADAQAKIAAYAQKYPNRPWIVGRGWNQEIWGLGRFPTATEIDAVVADRPVWLERVDGHAGWANSAALRAAGVTAKSISPEGGRIEKLGANPSGIFVDGAMELVNKAVPQPSAKDRDLALDAAMSILARYGITGIADMGTSVDDWLAFRRAGDRGALTVRIFSYSASVEPMAAIGAGAPTPWLYDDKLRMAGVKLYADGALGSRGANLKKPYADKPGERGLAFLSDTKLRNLMTRAAMDDFQIAVHAIGDGANDQVLDAMGELLETFKGDRRWRVEHAQILDPADIGRFARNGIIASMQPVHQTSDRLMAEARLGNDRLAGAYAWNGVLTAGGRIAFGSDVPVENPNPFVGLAVAISREDENGAPPGGWLPEQRVSREAALAGFTTGAAYASFADAKIGRLAPGMRADFVLIDRDPMTATPAEIRKTIVSETWVNGRKVYSTKP
jgi:predicted amidohydrolase YtcJ